MKSTLNAREVRDANKKFRSISNLLSFPRKEKDGSVKGGVLPTTVLLAFNTDITSSEIERYKKHTEDECPPCTVLCVLGKGYWFYNSASNDWRGLETNSDYPPFFEFCMFITGLMNTLSSEETTIRPFNPGAYINVDEIILSALKKSR